MTNGSFDVALKEMRLAYEASQALSSFRQFPDDDELHFENIDPHLINAAKLALEDNTLDATQLAPLRDALINLAKDAKWRETYKETKIGDTFLDNFGCYELLGLEGHFHCKTTRGFVVYSAPNLYYPWHHHPAEEMYFIIAGEAEFAVEGAKPRIYKPGDTIFHATNQPHNMQTNKSGVLAWVQWRGDLTTAPVLTDRLNGWSAI